MKSMLRILLVVNILLVSSCYSREIKLIDRAGTWTYGEDYRWWNKEAWAYVGSRPVHKQGNHDAVMCLIFMIDEDDHYDYTKLPYVELALLEAEPMEPPGRLDGVIDVKFGKEPMTRWFVGDSQETMGVAMRRSREFIQRAKKAGTVTVRYLHKGEPIVCTFDMAGFTALEEEYFPSLDGWTVVR